MPGIHPSLSCTILATRFYVSNSVHPAPPVAVPGQFGAGYCGALPRVMSAIRRLCYNLHSSLLCQKYHYPKAFCTMPRFTSPARPCYISLLLLPVEGLTCLVPCIGPSSDQFRDLSMVTYPPSSYSYLGCISVGGALTHFGLDVIEAILTCFQC